MGKEKFLKQLEQALRHISLEERQDIIRDYEEHFSFGLKEGKSEADIVASLGSPSQIAKELLASYHLDKVETKATTGNILRAVWAVIGLGFFNLVIVLGPFIALAALVFSGWITGIAFILSPLAAIVQSIFGTFLWYNIFSSILLCGLGILLSLGMYHVTKWFINGLIRYLKYNVKLVKGGMGNE